MVLRGDERLCAFQKHTNGSIDEIADLFKTKIQGWINYYDKFRKYKLNSLFRIFKEDLFRGQEGGISD